MPLEPQKMYQRCIVACRTNDEQLYIKLYKDVCADKLDQLLPLTKITMSDLDRLLTALSLAFAAATSAVQVMRYSHSLVAMQLSTVFVATAALLGVRAWRSISNNRNKYLAEQMRTLYYQASIELFLA